MGSLRTEVPSPGIAAFIDFTAQAKPVRFVSAGAFALHILPFGCNPGDARDRCLIGRGVLATPPFVRPFCKSVGLALAHRPIDTHKESHCSKCHKSYLKFNCRGVRLYATKEGIRSDANSKLTQLITF